jgi:hypothetical protein
MPEMKVMGILQNQWFRDPRRMEAIYARHGDDLDHRAALNRVYLFFHCETGRRLRSAFGEEVCHRIIWENASPKMVGKSDGAFPADLNHIRTILEHHKPQAVIGFGRIAVGGINTVIEKMWKEVLSGRKVELETIYVGECCHPTSRDPRTSLNLRWIADQLKQIEDFDVIPSVPSFTYHSFINGNLACINDHIA